MAWLRIDDGFASHPKISALSANEFRVYLRLLCYCSKTKDPTVDIVTKREVPGLTKRVVEKLESLHLLDTVGNAHEIHDWLDYLPRDATNAERQARWRARRNGKVTAKVTEEVTDDIPF